MKKCKTIAVVNQKGGVGKTTTTFNLAYELTMLGKKVLLVDLDSQGNLTMYAGENNPGDLKRTISSLMTQVLNCQEVMLTDTESCMIKSGEMDILPANIELSGVEVQLVNAMSREYILDAILKPLKEKYEYILIDCMPSLLMLPINALATSDSVLIPVTPEYWSAKGMETLLKNIHLVKRRINPAIKIEGVLFTMYDHNLILTKEITKILAAVFGDQVKIFKTKITRATDVARSTLAKKALSEYRPKHKVSLEYKLLAKEIIESSEV